MKFGKVSKEEFGMNKFRNDTGAHAIVLTEIGSSSFDSEGDWFKLVYKVHRRILIVDKNGYDEANMVITLYRGGEQEEKLLNLKASTYNLENGQVVETKMDGKSVFSEKIDKEYVNKRFTMPAVKEGSIIEYSYTVHSPFYQRLRPWNFQGEYPRLWSEYQVAIPEYFDYVQIQQGFESFAVKKSEIVRQTFSFVDRGASAGASSSTFTATPTVGKFTWASQDVPAIHPEKFITTTRNYVNRIEFQLSGITLPNTPRSSKQSTWGELMKNLMEDKDMGKYLTEPNYFLESMVNSLVSNTSSNEEKARKIYDWVRDNITKVGDDQIWTSQSLKTTFNSKKGNITDINILLGAMLIKAGLNAEAIVLSTRDHGYVFQHYPIYSRFNYTIIGLTLDDRYVTLDASDPLMGFGRLPIDCYNGGARKVNAFGDQLMLSADSIFEQRTTSVSILGMENGKMKGMRSRKSGYFESLALREKIKEEGKDKYLESLNKANNGLEINNLEFDGLDSLDKQLIESCNFEYAVDNPDIIYFTPMMDEAYKKNPFIAMERKFPVEMPYVSDEVFTLNWAIPQGYEVDELPKSARATLNGNDGYFEYILQQSDGYIQFRFRLQLKKANFLPEEYATLREFFDLVVKKQAEQIVLKKKK
ncbi:Transglutaminase-like superfamily protein [Chitinophaga terrae (ex Kim and Jung 2007)]|uniref:Transglutaminase-like superfamily protein n=1 Tax=Chitinophaga terrae (ex Kim and Jung 2007) TaxID=408074 RepID=A0A1H3YXR7_9BACT|nr:transglutaminase domain-containing protein [Chitinophaga terrae (ex Kim and Jung 2007)]MDQ0107286.1 hypothetical protein [Chitinophaga terrae (ex Kim and Jung 2007)]GEP88560.1 hypothetical protein CTE07_02050 [Chitinophaga terrae (ex Kim and Jung 2007)]SEA16230.1 Transglutaminase-like superfamily protein [Chitinophaga terrae (ex Kim and Jung 2007)]